MRTSTTQQQLIESRIRAAMHRLLAGHLPPGGKCDVKTLAAEADIVRSALYATYVHLKMEFEQRRATAQEASTAADPRQAQIARLKAEIDTLRRRLGNLDDQIGELKVFRTTAISRLAAQHH